MALTGLEVKNLDLLKPIFPLGQNRVIGEQIQVFDLHGRTMGDEFLPIFFRRIRNRRRDYAKVLSAFIRADVKKIAAMGNVVLMIGLARENDFPISIRIVCRNVAKFIRSLAV